MPPKQRRSSAPPSEAGRKRIHLTEQYCFQSDEIKPNFVLKHGHIWYFLNSNDFDINLTTSFIIAHFQYSPSAAKRKHVYSSIVNLAKAYRAYRINASKTKGRRSFEYFMELCECLYVLPPKLKITETFSLTNASHESAHVHMLEEKLVQRENEIYNMKLKIMLLEDKIAELQRASHQ